MPKPRLDSSGRDASDNWQPSIDYLWDTSRNTRLLRHIVMTIMLAGITLIVAWLFLF